MALALLCCSAGLSLSPWVCNCLVRLSIVVAQGLELLPLGIVLLLQVGEVALAFVGLGHGHLESDDGDLGGPAERRQCWQARGGEFGRRRSGQRPRPA